jgi:acetone carboxylase gamma subunit
MLDMFKTNQLKETMTNQELKKKVISSMKKDDELKKYVKDFQDLSTEQFDILMKIIDRAYLKVKNK